MSAQNCAIDLVRLQALLDGINRFGRNPASGGFNRPGFSEADMAVRRWFAETMAGDGMTVTSDAAANVFGRFGPAEGPCVMAGSHLDTVPEGGAFDGALGVAVALECVRAMRDAGIAPATAIEVVATAEEEGRFGGMLGSQAIAGQVSPEWLDAAADAEGVKLSAAMRACGLDPQAVPSCRRAPESVRAYLELHVEQGPTLEVAGIPVGIADSISGVCLLFVHLHGVANHSGTTPMTMRADAFAGLAAIAASILALIAAFGTGETRITIGKVEVRPNFAHTIPGDAAFTVVLRDTDEQVMRTVTERMIATIAAVAAANGLTHTVETRSWLPPVKLDTDLVALLGEKAASLGIRARTMPSGAGHDAQTMQSLCPSALIFVPSRGGVSHAPEEWTGWPDIEKGANLMLAALIELAAG